MRSTRVNNHMERETKGWTRLTDAVFLLLLGIVSGVREHSISGGAGPEDDALVRDSRGDV